MEIVDRFGSAPVFSRELAGLRSYDGRLCRAEASEVPAEHAIEVYVDGVLSMRAVCTPDALADLAVGRLFTEGMISDAADIVRVEVDSQGTCVRVETTNDIVLPYGIDAVGTCFAGRLRPGDGCTELRPVKPIFWSDDDIFALARRFRRDSPGHKRTFGLHSCYLAYGSDVLFFSEDLGRHNAFDKAVGRALREGVDLTKTTVFTSGRIPVDMLSKAVRAGIPIMVSKAVPTDAAITMARSYDLTLICSAHPDAVTVFCDQSRRGHMDRNAKSA